MLRNSPVGVLRVILLAGLVSGVSLAQAWAGPTEDLETAILKAAPSTDELATQAGALAFAVSTARGSVQVRASEYYRVSFTPELWSFTWPAKGQEARKLLVSGGLLIYLEEFVGNYAWVEVPVELELRAEGEGWRVTTVTAAGRATECEGIAGATTRMGTPAVEGGRLVCHASR